MTRAFSEPAMCSLSWLLLTCFLCRSFVLSTANLSARGTKMRCRAPRAYAIQRELEWATMMLTNARQVMSIEDPYFRAFFPRDTSHRQVREIRQNVLFSLVEVARPGNSDYEVTITCKQDDRCIARSESRATVLNAWTDVRRRRINFCDRFFEEGHYSRLMNRQIDGPTDGIQCDSTNRASLWAYRSRGR